MDFHQKVHFMDFVKNIQTACKLLEIENKNVKLCHFAESTIYNVHFICI